MSKTPRTNIYGSLAITHAYVENCILPFKDAKDAWKRTNVLVLESRMVCSEKLWSFKWNFFSFFLMFRLRPKQSTKCSENIQLTWQTFSREVVDKGFRTSYAFALWISLHVINIYPHAPWALFRPVHNWIFPQNEVPCNTRLCASAAVKPYETVNQK